jgi:alpha-L-glutamate ligase-like protein
VLYRGVPVMAMVRLPTLASRGRANLHQGAVAAAIDLAAGRTFGGVWRNRPVDRHPDTGGAIHDIVVPQWPELLESAVRLADGVGLGYLGVDFVLDAATGPVVLEANARPGLAIQTANRRGLLHRLAWVDSHAAELTSFDQRLGAAAHLADMD